jgi:predicted Zn-dependent protease
MDYALNSVTMSKDVLESASDEVLREYSGAVSRKYDIDVPAAVTEYPQFANTVTKIYLLSISHENQTKIVGVAGNLDLFKDEFNFKSKEDKQYLPLHSSGKDFDLDRAYTKSMPL